MVQDVRQRGLEVVEALDEPRARDRVPPDLLELLLGQRARLAEHAGVDGDLPDVVERAAEVQRLEARAAPAEHSGKRLRERRHPCRMPPQVRVASLEGGGEGGEQGPHCAWLSRAASGSLPCRLPGSVEFALREGRSPERNRRRRAPGGARARLGRAADGCGLHDRCRARRRRGRRIRGRGVLGCGRRRRRARQPARRRAGRRPGRGAGSGGGRRARGRDGPDRLPLAAHRHGRDRASRRAGRRRVRDGVDPPDHAGAVDGRALVAEHGHRLQGRRRRRRPAAAALPAPDDRGRDRRPGEGPRPRRGRRRPAGDRDRAAARGHRLGLRRPAGGARASREPRCVVPRPRHPGHGDERRLRGRADRGGAGAPAGCARGADSRLRRRRDDGARARPAGAEADPGDCGGEDAARLGDRRSRRRDRRQLRADRARHRGGAPRRHDRRLHRLRLTDALPREPALLAQRHRAPAPPGPGRRAGARLRRRDHRAAPVSRGRRSPPR